MLLLGMAMVLGLMGCGKKAQAVSDNESQNLQKPVENQAVTETEQNEEQEKSSEKEDAWLTVVQNRMETEEQYIPEEGESFPYAYISYPSFESSEDLKKAYPALADNFTMVNEELYQNAMSTFSNASEWIQEDDIVLYCSNQETWSPDIVRADDCAVGWLMTMEHDFNGPHPTTYYGSCMMDTETGEILPLADVVKDMMELPQYILENLIIVDDTYVFSEEENEQMLSIIEDMVAENYLVWTMDDTGFHVYFDAYALQYYAFGPIFADLSYQDYPDLFYEKYIPAQTKVVKNISYKEGESTVVSNEELAQYRETTKSEGAGDNAGYYSIECPDWEVPYMADGIFDTLTESPIKLTEVEKESSDCLFADEWSKRTGIALPEDLYGEGYSDQSYYYVADNSADEGRLALEVSEAGSYNLVGTYDFASYLYTPVPGNAFTTLEIPYAVIYDGVLYTEIAHRTYSADQPYTGFIVAVEVETGKLLWRSEMLLANGRNFVVGEDTIICGYGFTAEEDYMYVLSRHSGAVLEKRKLKSGPDYFIPVEESLYVLTYNTAYQYKVGVN